MVGYSLFALRAIEMRTRMFKLQRSPRKGNPTQLLALARAETSASSVESLFDPERT
jgi:hypothetical protein